MRSLSRHEFARYPEQVYVAFQIRLGNSNAVLADKRLETKLG